MLLLRCLAASLCLAVLVPRTARAEAPLLTVAIRAGDDDAARLQDVVQELLTRTAVRPSVSRVTALDWDELTTGKADPAHALARAFLDLSSREQATVLLIDESGERMLVRQLRCFEGHGEACRQELAHILESAVDSLMRGERFAMSREQALASLPKTPPPSAPPSLRGPSPVDEATPRQEGSGGPRAVWEIAAGYEVERLSSTIPLTQGPMLTASVRGTRRTTVPHASLWAEYRLPVVVHDDPVGARLEGFNAIGMVGGETTWSPSFGLRASIGGGVEVTHVSPVLTSGRALALRSAWIAASPLLRANVALVARLSNRLVLIGGALLDVDPSGTEYLWADGDQTSVAFKPYAVRPSVYFGVAFR